MNCLTARQTLELAQSDGAPSGRACLDEPADDVPASDHFVPHDFDRTLVDEASRHVEGCPVCRTVLRRQEEFDKTLGGMIRDVAVPGDLKERLRACLKPASRDIAAGLSEVPCAASSASMPAGEIPSVPAAANRATPLPARSVIGSRRRWLGAISLTAAVCVVAGIGVNFWWQKAEPVSLEEIGALLARTDINADHLPEFTQFRGGLSPQVPTTMRTQRMVFPARRLGNLDVAVYFFTLPSRTKTPLAGRLAVIPIRLVRANQVPLATSFLGGPTPTIYKGGFCITSWVEGGFVYVCCLEGAEDELHRLQPKRQMT